MNPHDRNDHKILSLARLPVPTLPHVCQRLSYNTKQAHICQHIFLIFFIFFDFFEKYIFLCQAFLKMSQNNGNICPGFFCWGFSFFVGSAHTRPSSGRQGKKLFASLLGGYSVSFMSRNFHGISSSAMLTAVFHVFLTTAPLPMLVLFHHLANDVLAV